MTSPYYQPHGDSHNGEHPPHGPAWKRMHRSPFFWVAAICIMAAMYVYVMTNNLSVTPGEKPPPPLPALAP